MREALRAVIAELDPIDEREAQSIKRTLTRLGQPGDLFDERENDHHLTASAFVVSRRGVILHRHKRLGLWLQPGGHVDPGETPVEASRRETLEETGLLADHLNPPLLLHVDVHPGPRGHTHYDVRYVLVSTPLDPAPPAGESPEVEWFAPAAARERCEPALVGGLNKLFAMTSTLELPD